MSSDIVTRSVSQTRSGAYTSETILTPALVKTRGVKTLLTLQTPDDPRLEAQPLYLSGLDINGKKHNVVYQATMGNIVYAWDADTGALLWKTNVGKPISGASAVNNKNENQIDTHKINVHWGILSTPFIDRTAGVLYACAWISVDKTGNWRTGEHHVVALNVATGAMVKPPLSLEGVTYNPGHGLAALKFRSEERKQRAALAMVEGALLVSFGTIMETAKTARGWIIAVDTAKWKAAAAWTSTAQGSGAGIWMSGAGPAIQSDGAIWVVTGNGDFDGEVDFGESVVRLRYTPAVGAAKASLAVTGWWTPWTDDGRTGGDDEGEGPLSGLPTASNFRTDQHLAHSGLTAAQIQNLKGAWGDQDLGASGVVLVETLGVALVSGKDGVLYTINLNNPGNPKPQDLAAGKAAANYAKLATPPILYTFFDASVQPAPGDPMALNRNSADRTHHLHGTPVVWPSAAHGLMHFCGGENGNLRAWQFNADKSSKYLGCSAAVASPQAAVPFGGMPGWSIVLSANGEQNGIVWAMFPYGDANMQITNGRLLAYDAADLARFSDGSGEIVPLWDSQDWNWNFPHPKFNRPVTADGKIFVPTYDGRLLVLGLA